MKGLLAPAIIMMNKLSYAKKFGVISLTFFIPLLLLSYAIINQTYQSIQKTQNEYESLEVIDDLLVVLDSLSLFRDYAAVHVLYPASDIGIRADQLEKEFLASVDNFVTRYPDKQLSTEITQKLPQWRKTLARSGENLQTTYMDQSKVYSQVVNDLLLLIQEEARHAGLMQDENSDVTTLSKLILMDYPLLSNNFSQSHSVALFSLMEDFIRGDTYTLLNNTYDSLNDTINTAQHNHELLVSENPILAGLFKESFSQVENDMLSFLSEIDESIISASIIEVKWKSISENYQAKLAGVNKVREIASNKLGGILEARIADLTKKLMLVFVAITMVMLLIVYLYAAFFWSVRSTVGNFHDAARQISQGDMRVRVKVSSQDEMGELTSEFNSMVENIHSLMQAVQNTSTEVASSMTKVGDNAEISKNGANDQLLQTEQVASAVTQMAATAEEVNRQSDEAATSATQATNQAAEANDVVSETLSDINALADEIMKSTEVINTLSENSENIASMLAVIKGIAEQTNLLALNAAIEAARAGEQGRGFAVVADEVRTLASRTQASAQEIEEVMTSIHTGISSAVEVMGNSHMMAQGTVETSSQVRDALEKIVEMIEVISGINNQISISSSEQTNVAKAIDENVVKINDVGRATVGDAQHTVEAIKEVMALTDSLREKMERFQV